MVFSKHVERIDKYGIAYTGINLCQMCGDSMYEHKHHLLSQTEQYKKEIGNLIHLPYNILKVCERCHLCKPIPKLSEEEYLAFLIDRGYLTREDLYGKGVGKNSKIENFTGRF